MSKGEIRDTNVNKFSSFESFDIESFSFKNPKPKLIYILSFYVLTTHLHTKIKVTRIQGVFSIS